MAPKSNFRFEKLHGTKINDLNNKNSYLFDFM